MDAEAGQEAGAGAGSGVDVGAGQGRGRGGVGLCNRCRGTRRPLSDPLVPCSIRAMSLSDTGMPPPWRNTSISTSAEMCPQTLPCNWTDQRRAEEAHQVVYLQTGSRAMSESLLSRVVVTASRAAAAALALPMTSSMLSP